MKKFLIFLFVIANVSFATAQVEDQSFEYNGESIVKSVFTVPASAMDIWSVYDNNKGFMTWGAPVAEVDWRRGGTIRSSFSVEGVIGDETTTTSYIVNYIPLQEIVIKDELLPLLEMGIKQGWMEDIPSEFLEELRENGSDIYTTIQLQEKSGNETQVTVYSTGYKSGGYWDTMFGFASGNNIWIYQKLIDRFKNGPVDWTKTN